MKKQVSVDEVSLSVVGVSIKAVQIGKKQMTLSVFRQLEHEAVWDPETFKSRGVVWGRVNYFWPDDSDHSYFGFAGVFQSQYEPVHIVWQAGSALRRSFLYPDIGEYRESYPLYLPREGDSYGPRKRLLETRKISDKLIQKWTKFYEEYIESTEQLFIAV